MEADCYEESCSEEEDIYDVKDDNLIKFEEMKKEKMLWEKRN
jgi:hypothetical protein